MEKTLVQIIKDLNRTHTKDSYFGEGQKGREYLLNVLEVVSFKYTGIGYVQVMNYLVAAFLYHASPSVTLGIMTFLMEECQL